MNKKIIGILAIALLAIVFTASLSHYVLSQPVFNQPNQTGNTANPPSPIPTPTPSPSEKPTEPASILKPSVPEFTVKLVDKSYDVPTTYSTDPYTGEKVTHEGYHVEKIGIQIKIKNQPFVPYYDDSRGWNIGFDYNIRMKGHFSEEWSYLYRASDGFPPQWSDSDYTVITYTDGVFGTQMIDLPPNAQVDFQVEAMIGYTHRVVDGGFAPWRFTGEKSGWSSTQTITIP